MTVTDGRDFALSAYPSVKAWAKPPKRINFRTGTPPCHHLKALTTDPKTSTPSSSFVWQSFIIGRSRHFQTDDSEPGPLLVVRPNHVPRRYRVVRAGEHLVPRRAIVVPAFDRNLVDRTNSLRTETLLA